MKRETASGKLFVVATPIGNFEDITYRAVRTLQEVDFIVCEDTRVSGNLLAHYNIKNKLISFNAKSEGKKIESVIKELLSGKSCALISDAGTPTISDPGVRLINRALKESITVHGIPGANAAILALSISGIPTDSFLFEGFLPQKKRKTKKTKRTGGRKSNNCSLRIPLQNRKTFERNVGLLSREVRCNFKGINKKV